MSKGSNVEVRGFSRFEAVENLYVSGTLLTSGSIMLGQWVVDGDSDLILSSSATSQVSVSGTLTFPNSGRLSHIVAKDEHLVLSSSAGSYVKVSGNFDVLGTLTQNGSPVGGGGQVTGSTNFFVISDLDSRGTLRNSIGHLILSSTVGSVISFSASQQFNQDLSSHIVAKNSYLILSSSTGSVVGMSASQDFVNSDNPYHIRSVNSDLVLSSSSTSAVVISGTLNFAIDASSKKGHIIANSSDLILSSSTSTIAISGSGLFIKTFPAINVASIGTSPASGIGFVGTAVKFILGSATVATVGSTGITDANGSGYALNAGAATTTSPNVVMNSGDSDTGVTWKNANAASLMAAGKDIAVFFSASGVNAGAVLHVSGALKLQSGISYFSIRTVSLTSSLNQWDSTILASASLNDISIRLPDATTVFAGTQYNIKKIDASVNQVVVSGSGTQLIDDATTHTLTTQYQSITIQNSGSNWYII